MKACLLIFSLLVAVSTTATGQGHAQAISLRPSTRGLPARGLAFGASFVGNLNFSVQAHPAVGARFQKNAYAFPTGELVASYTWPHGWRLESGLGVGSVAAITLDAREQFGQAATVSFGTVQLPLRVYRHFSLGATSRYSLSPLAGLQVVTLSVGEKVSARQPIYSGQPEYGSQRKWFRASQEHTLTYQAGASLNYLAPKLELNAFVRYTNSFGNPVVAEGAWEYDLQGIEQPALSTTSRLESVAVGAGIRWTLFAR